MPTQALFFMNDPFVHEQAEGFARRLLAAGGDECDRIRLAYRMAMAREPLDEEIEQEKGFPGAVQPAARVDGVAAEPIPG